MTEIDRGTDRCIGAFGSVLDSIVRAFDHEGILPLSDEEAARRADAALVRSEFAELAERIERELKRMDDAAADAVFGRQRERRTP